MRYPRITAFSLLLPAVAACATASISMSEIDPAGQPVTAEASSFNFLGFNPMPIERLSELRDALSEQCGGSGVTGVVALSSTVYVIVGVIEKIQVSGHCTP